jgi:alkylated DNA repair dioxygenase AlkB
MPPAGKSAQGSGKTPVVELLPDAPKPWISTRPRGLYISDELITKATRDALWKFFHPKDGRPEGEAGDKTARPREDGFPWYQRFKRFPKTAHYQGWHSGKYVGQNGMATFKQELPELYQAVDESLMLIKKIAPDEMALKTFLPESVAVMRHKPGWGLGTHYDNAHDVNKGAVLMLSISDDDTVPRKFQFTNPPRGRIFTISTPDRNVLFFTGEAYDQWMHESLHNPKQSGECISMTIRLAEVCGYQAELGSLSYATGAPAAKRIAHKRIRESMNPEDVTMQSNKAPRAYE